MKIKVTTNVRTIMFKPRINFCAAKKFERMCVVENL